MRSWAGRHCHFEPPDMFKPLSKILPTKYKVQPWYMSKNMILTFNKVQPIRLKTTYVLCFGQGCPLLCCRSAVKTWWWSTLIKETKGKTSKANKPCVQGAHGEMVKRARLLSDIPRPKIASPWLQNTLQLGYVFLYVLFFVFLGLFVLILPPTSKEILVKHI